MGNTKIKLGENIMEKILSSLQNWYHSYCNGDWEHDHGIKIYFISRPGWRVVIDLDGTDYEDEKFAVVEKKRTELDWYRCFVKSGKFEGIGGIRNLHEILLVFEEFFLSIRNNKS